MWLELSLRVHRREWSRVESALAQVGALSVTLLDAEDHAILEPAVGDTPLWPELLVNALFDGNIDRRGIQAVLQELVYTLDDARFAFREVADLLAARDRLAEQLAAQEAAAQAQERVLAIAEARYKAGISSYLEVLDAQRGQYSARQASLQARRAWLANSTQLYKALGGGARE